jgi:hypothetical protein
LLSLRILFVSIWGRNLVPGIQLPKLPKPDRRKTNLSQVRNDLAAAKAMEMFYSNQSPEFGEMELPTLGPVKREGSVNIANINLGKKRFSPFNSLEKALGGGRDIKRSASVAGLRVIDNTATRKRAKHANTN